jgi:hypothetical protein
MVFVDDARRHLQIYDTSHLYVFGDLNYRVSLKNPRHLSLEQFGDMLKKDHRELLVHDQLYQEIKGARTLHGLSEGEITFPPSYKFKVGTDDYKVNTALHLLVRRGLTNRPTGFFKESTKLVRSHLVCLDWQSTCRTVLLGGFRSFEGWAASLDCSLLLGEGDTLQRSQANHSFIRISRGPGQDRQPKSAAPSSVRC